MKFGDLQLGVDKYQAIPKDDFQALINAEPPPPMPRICRTCGKQFGNLDWSWSWSDIALELKLGHKDKEYIYRGYCPTHNLYAEEEEDEEAEEEED
uniref:Uncharacterized protein n=1 Tax=viral metagenome TaxID=1070528 RepID=A0A6H2A565_9ZZZZ